MVHKTFIENTIKKKGIFDERKHAAIHLPFSSKNIKYSAYFMKNLFSFTNGKVKFKLVQNPRKFQLLFTLKNKFQHLGSVIYKGICSCVERYVSETFKICKIR